MSNITDLWLSGVSFQALNTPKLVFGRGGRHPLGCQPPPAQIPGYAHGITIPIGLEIC